MSWVLPEVVERSSSDAGQVCQPTGVSVSVLSLMHGYKYHR